MSNNPEVIMPDGAIKRQGDSLAPQGVVVSLTSNGNGLGSTATKIQLTTKEFDPYGWFDNVTNYRFTPKIAGYYNVNGLLRMAVNLTSARLDFWVYKNGSLYKSLGINRTAASSSDEPTVGGSCMVYLNGSTDYIEFYGSQSFSAGGQAHSGGLVYTHIDMALVGYSAGQVPEPWHVIGTAGEPAFQNGWVNQSVNYLSARFYKDPNGQVYLQGSLLGSSATANPAFTLPAGYRPSLRVEFPSTYVPTTGSTPQTLIVAVLNTGAVSLFPAAQWPTDAWTNTMRYALLNGVSFLAEL